MAGLTYANALFFALHLLNIMQTSSAFTVTNEKLFRNKNNLKLAEFPSAFGNLFLK